MTRFPAAPLLDAMDGTLQEKADVLRIAVRNVYRMQRDGLSERQADRYAVAAGYHPYEIWDNWFLLTEITLPADLFDAAGIDA